MKRLDQPELAALRTAKRHIDLLTAELAVAKSDTDLLVAKAFAKHDLFMGTYQICLECGMFHLPNHPCDCVHSC